MDTRTEEDKIIEILQIEGGNFYDDMDFIPGRQSLYDVEDIIPQYDEEIVDHIVWKRPNEFCENPEYFTESLYCPSGVQGSLSDEIFLGTLLGVCSFTQQDLIQNIIASRHDDFKQYGVYTCRFYVEGEWVDVITDTRIPCLQDVRGRCSPVYGKSTVPDEMWICLIEKAYAKAVGSYEALQKVKVNEALLHLTGGSVQQFNIQDEQRADNGYFNMWKLFKENLSNETLILTLPISNDTPEAESKEAAAKPAPKLDLQKLGIIADRLYSVLAFKEVGNHELVLLCNPWGNRKVVWKGEWSETSVRWDDFPEVIQAINKDTKIQWKREDPQGYIWMSFREFLEIFNTTYMCKVFSNDRYKYYCMKGEWRDKVAGGPMHTIRDKEEATNAANESYTEAIRKATAAVVLDGDSSWFNNPQFRISVPNPTNIYISVLAFGSELDNAPVVAVDVVSVVRNNSQVHLWDCTYVEPVAQEKIYTLGRVKGAEASIWNLALQPRKIYYVVPHTMRRGIQGSFILRIHSLGTLTIENVDSLPMEVVAGEWRRSSELDTTGGPLTFHEGSKENAKWCQNPQYHVELADTLFDEELNMKVVVRRTDKKNPTTGANANDKSDTPVGLVICKTEFLEDSLPVSKKDMNKGPRKNAFGEVMNKKESSLKKSASYTSQTDTISKKTLLRKISVKQDTFFAVSTFATRNEACVYLARIPRVWMSRGLMIIPCLGEKGVRGTYEMEIYCSATLSVRMLSDSTSKCIAGEWMENLAGGSHLCPAWKKNPKFNLKLRSMSDLALKVRISLHKHGEKWKKVNKKDAVGSMIGFYLFVNRNGELTPLLETPFVPANEVVTDPEFALEVLPDDEVYTIMPTTYAENQYGAFILTVMSNECDFMLTKESHHHQGHK